jgi:hypothetical protein
MKPYIICHMLSSVDGRIDGNTLDAVIAEGEYEATGAKLEGDAWICGRTTMQQHFAEDEPFVSASNTPAEPQPVFVARGADSYAISVDTLGNLRWSSGDLDGDHLVCVVSEQVPADYLAMLREKGIIAGPRPVDSKVWVFLKPTLMRLHALFCHGLMYGQTAAQSNWLLAYHRNHSAGPSLEGC